MCTTITTTRLLDKLIPQTAIEEDNFNTLKVIGTIAIEAAHKALLSLERGEYELFDSRAGDNRCHCYNFHLITILREDLSEEIGHLQREIAELRQLFKNIQSAKDIRMGDSFQESKVRYRVHGEKKSITVADLRQKITSITISPKLEFLILSHFSCLVSEKHYNEDGTFISKFDVNLLDRFFPKLSNDRSFQRRNGIVQHIQQRLTQICVRSIQEAAEMLSKTDESLFLQHMVSDAYVAEHRADPAEIKIEYKAATFDEIEYLPRSFGSSFYGLRVALQSLKEKKESLLLCSIKGGQYLVLQADETGFYFRNLEENKREKPILSVAAFFNAPPDEIIAFVNEHTFETLTLAQGTGTIDMQERKNPTINRDLENPIAREEITGYRQIREEKFHDRCPLVLNHFFVTIPRKFMEVER